MIDKITNAFIAWCADNSPAARLQQRVVEGVLSALVVSVTTGEWGAAFAVAVTMAILTPIKNQLGNKEESENES